LFELSALHEFLESSRLSALQVFADCIFEHGEHQLLLAVQYARPAYLVVVLNRKYH